jgi:hypothetical protein
VREAEADRLRRQHDARRPDRLDADHVPIRHGSAESLRRRLGAETTRAARVLGTSRQKTRAPATDCICDLCQGCRPEGKRLLLVPPHEGPGVCGTARPERPVQRGQPGHGRGRLGKHSQHGEFTSRQDRRLARRGANHKPSVAVAMSLLVPNYRVYDRSAVRKARSGNSCELASRCGHCLT